MRVLGIDQSYSCTGFVISEDKRMIHAEVYKTTTENDKFYRSWLIAREASRIAKRFQVDHIIIEDLAFGARGDATRDLGGLLYVLVTKLNVIQQYPMDKIAPTTLKKFATGHGFAKKEHVIEALPPHIRNQFDDIGVKKTTGLSDLADAYFLSQIFWREYY